MIKKRFAANSILLLGPTGAGKSPLGDQLAQSGLFGRRCHHMDFGSELRRAVSGGSASAPYSVSELDFIRGVLERGLLLENENFPLAEKVIALFMTRSAFRSSDILVLNGIPRHEGQARDMEHIALVHALVFLDCSADDVVRRIRDNVGGDRMERNDDDAALIEKKIRVFRERSAPLISYYEQQGKRIYRVMVTATMSPGDTYRQLSALSTAHPPIAFVAEPPER